MLTVEIALPEVEELQKLVQEGLEKGVLNYDEIASGLYTVELSTEQGGLARPDPRGREVRLPQGLQVLDLCDLVDPPGGDPGDRRQGANDPDSRPHGREAEQGRAHRAPARAAAWAGAAARRDRRG